MWRRVAVRAATPEVRACLRRASEYTCLLVGRGEALLLCRIFVPCGLCQHSLPRSALGRRRLSTHRRAHGDGATEAVPLSGRELHCGLRHYPRCSSEILRYAIHSFRPPVAHPESPTNPHNPHADRPTESAVGPGQFPARVARLLLLFVGLVWVLGLVLVPMSLITTLLKLSFRQANGASFASWAPPEERVPPPEPRGHADHYRTLGRLSWS